MKRKTVRGIGANAAMLNELASSRDGWVETFERIISGKSVRIGVSICADIEQEKAEMVEVPTLGYRSPYGSLYVNLNEIAGKEERGGMPTGYTEIQERIAVQICVLAIQNLDAKIGQLVCRNDALNGLAASAEEMFKAYEVKRNGEKR